MAQFMLLLYNNMSAPPPQFSPEEMQQMLEKYTAWMHKPFTKDGQRLGNDMGRVIRPGAGGPRAVDGPYSETKEVLGGYYTIEAADYDEAVKLALGHPHIEYGGTVEVRQVWGT
jgi:hypothetical protein